MKSSNDKNNRPIGVFDSGLGGLTVVKEIQRVMPNEDIVYLGDTARVPYGTRSGDTVIKFALEDTKFLLQKKVKCVVIACNTASAFAGEEVKSSADIPVFEVVTWGAIDAVSKSKRKEIGVIGTRGTIKSDAYRKAINKIDSKANVYSYPCPLLVPLIEETIINGSTMNTLLKSYLSPFKKNKIDTLILGCTHYPIIYRQIQHILKNVMLINPAKLLSVNLKSFLNKNNLINKTNRKAKNSYYVTDLNFRFIEVAEMFLGKKINTSIRKVNIKE